MKVLLLGGTGAMGEHLAKVLAGSGNDVFVTSRRTKKSSGNITYYQGNAKDLEFLKTILNQHWDSIVDFMIYSVPEFQERVLLLLNATSHYIFLSSSRVYSDVQSPITEENPRLLDCSTDEKFLDSNEYSLRKARQEDILTKSKLKNWTILRPYITYGDSRLQLGPMEKENWLYRAIKGRTIVFSKDIAEKLTTMTYGFDVSSFIAKILNDSDAYGEAFTVSGSYSCSWEQILNIYLDVLEKLLGKRPKVLFQNLEDFSIWNPGEYHLKYDRLYDRVFDTTKMEKFISTDDFLKPEIGLTKCLENFIKHPGFNYIDWRYEAIKDKIVSERTSIFEIRGIKQKILYLKYRYFKEDL